MHICVYICILYSYTLLYMCSKGVNLERTFPPGLQVGMWKVNEMTDGRVLSTIPLSSVLFIKKDMN